MEIKELITYYLNPESNLLEISFRTIEDNDDVLRTDSIDAMIAEDYGFELMVESFDFFDEEFLEEEDGDDEKMELDEDEVITFLNEYYTINPEKLPRPEFY
jgi:hypothetical protein